MKKQLALIICLFLAIGTMAQEKPINLKPVEKRNLRYVSETLFPSDWMKCHASISFTGSRVVIKEEGRTVQYAVGEAMDIGEEDEEVETHAWKILDSRDRVGVFTIMKRESIGVVWITILFGNKGITYKLSFDQYSKQLEN